MLTISDQSMRNEITTVAQQSNSAGKEEQPSAPQFKVRSGNFDEVEKNGQRTHEGREDLRSRDGQSEEYFIEKTQSSSMAASKKSTELLPSSSPRLSTGKSHKSAITQQQNRQIEGGMHSFLFPLKTEAEIKQASIAIAAKFNAAVEDGNLDELERLVRNGASINQTLGNGKTPLFLAAQQGRKKMVELLLRCGAMVNLSIPNRKTPLYIASQCGHTEIAELLIQNGAAIDLASIGSVSPLYVAVQNKHEEMVALLLQKEATVDLATIDGITPLFVAAFKGYTTIAAKLLAKGASIDLMSTLGFCPLDAAAQNGHRKIVELILNQLASIDLTKPGGYKPIFFAAQKGHADIVSVFINKYKYSRTAQGFFTRCLHALDVPYIDIPNLHGDTLLHIAVQHGHLATSAVLIAEKADINLPDRDGNTPLLLAASQNHVACLALLLQAGAKPELRNKAGLTALNLALAAPQPHSLIIDLLFDTAAPDPQTTRSAYQQIDTALLSEQAVALLIPGQQADTQQAAAWKSFVYKLSVSLGLRHIVAEGLAVILRQMPPLWPGSGGNPVKPTAVQVRQLVWHMLASAQRLHELSNENDPNRAAFYDAPQALPAAAKLIGVAAGQSRQVMADAEAVLRDWRGELDTFMTSLASTTSGAELEVKLHQQIGLHPLLADAIATLWTSLGKPKSVAGLRQAMRWQFNTPAFASSVIEAGNSDVLRFMLMEQIKALTKR